MDRVLAIGYGNPSRLDDGLGPALAEMLESRAVPGVTVEAAYQLTVEDAASIAEYDAVVFADASVSGPEPFHFGRVEPGAQPEIGFTSHALEPETLLALARDLFESTAEGYVLGIRGYQFDDFGESLSDQAASNLASAAQFIVTALENRTLGESADRAAAAGEGAQMADGKHVILVVDDDPDVRDTLQLVLERHGYEMVGASSAEEGLRQFDACKPDLIIVDLMMEEVDSGKNIVKELQLRGNTAPVYMLSSVGDALHHNISYTDLGLAGVFQKPIDVATLTATLASRLE